MIWALVYCAKDRLSLALARRRLIAHMYDRMVQGGTPECPCERCDRDRDRVRVLSGEEWSHPAEAMWWRDFERAAAAVRPGGLPRAER